MYDYILENKKQCMQDFDLITSKIKGSELEYHGGRVRTLAIPKIFSEAQFAFFKNFCNECFLIFDKVINQYFTDSSYRKLFPFSKELEELILLSPQYGCLVPICRIDIFYDELTGSAKLCEINTDGSSAMNEDRFLGALLPDSSAFNAVFSDKDYRKLELFDSFVERFLKLFNDYSIKNNLPQKQPFVAIIDFLEKGSVNEFERFKEAFIRSGIDAEVCDIRLLRFDGKRLMTPVGKVIDAIYRRAVTTDIMENILGVTDFISAIKSNAVCVIGQLHTQIIHNKFIFSVLHNKATLDLMSDAQRSFIKAHVPKTYDLNDETIKSLNLIETKDNWIIKPYDLYASKGVMAGRDADLPLWESLLSKNSGKDYLVQEFCPPFKSLNFDFESENKEPQEFSNITGIYCYAYEAIGVYSRMSGGNVISSQYNEKTVPTLMTN